MVALTTLPLMLWLVSFLATPGRPRPGDEVTELVYARLLGRQQLLRLAALFATAVLAILFVATLPARVDPDLQAVRQARTACAAQLRGGSACNVMQSGGGWAQEQAQQDGSWVLVSTTTAPVRYGNPVDEPRP